MQAYDQRPIPNVAVTTVAGITAPVDHLPLLAGGNGITLILSRRRSRPIYLRAFAQAEVFAQA
jgi:hypothetical protein